MSSSKYRSESCVNNVVGLSVSYQRDNLLARGLGLEHLRELLMRLARPLLRHAASLAYGGHWKETEDNFTFDLLRLVSAEQRDAEQEDEQEDEQEHAKQERAKQERAKQEDNSPLRIGRLFNHSPWPDYLDVTPRIEARWINSCRIVRVTQQDAGIDAADVVSDAEARGASDRALYNAAVTLSAMRRRAMEGTTIDMPDLPSPEVVPPIMACVVLGGRVKGFRGFLPGIFEEALVALERQRPLYVLGGFGGAAEVLCKALVGPGPGRPKELNLDFLRAENPGIQKLQDLSARFPMPVGVRNTAELLNALFQYVEKARLKLADTLNTGLSDQKTRELLTTRDIGRAVHLVREGLKATVKLGSLAE